MKINVHLLPEPSQEFYKQTDDKKMKQRLREKFQRLAANRQNEVDEEIRYFSAAERCRHENTNVSINLIADSKEKNMLSSVLPRKFIDQYIWY